MMEAIIINSSTPAKYAIIWCHGLDNSGHDYISFVKELQETTAKQIGELIQQQIIAGISTENIFLGGFSQRAAALHAGLRYPSKLDRLISFSGYLLIYMQFVKKRYRLFLLLQLFLEL